MSVSKNMLASTLKKPVLSLRLLLGCAAMLAIAGCATLDPEANRLGPADVPAKPQGQEPAVPSAAPPTTGMETRAAADQRYVISLFGGVYRSAATESHLNAILAKLATASETPQTVYKVTLLNSPAVNAFALPSGDLFVTRGLLALANDSSEIAAVMAHEIGHVAARHAFHREEQQKIEQLRTNVANTVQTKRRGEEIKATGLLNLASFSRQQELEADRFGVALIGRAGFDPYGASRFLRSLGRSLEWRTCQQDSGTQRERVDIMSSHPSTPGRIEQAILAARQIGAPGIGDHGREAYLDAINGIDYGDDPTDGIVRGTTFTHVKLGFTFNAPDDFALENCAQAMIGVTPSRLEAIRLDIVQVPATSSVGDYVNTGWVEGLQKSSIQLRAINGMQGAIAEADSSGWKFRVGVVRLNGEVARIIFAARTMTPELDQRFIKSIESFKRLGAGETQRVRPLKMSLVTATATDTPESLARRMAISTRPLDLFLMLNGIQKGKPLDRGGRYKLISE